jgi:hypothetical protein
MIKKYKAWYKRLSNRKQLLLFFFLLGCYWFLANHYILSRLINENHSLVYDIANAIWMGMMMTTVFNWEKVRDLFRKQAVALPADDLPA